MSLRCTLLVILSVLAVLCNGEVNPRDGLNVLPLESVNGNTLDSSSIVPETIDSTYSNFTKNELFKKMQKSHQMDSNFTENKSYPRMQESVQMDEKLNELSSAIVYAIIAKIEAQNQITSLVLESLKSTGRQKGVNAINTRRTLDYVSRRMSNQITKITSANSSEPELQKFIYGLAQTAAEVSIIAALKDVTFASVLSKKHSVDTLLRRKRSIVEQLFESATTESTLLDDTTQSESTVETTENSYVGTSTHPFKLKGTAIPLDQYAVLPRNERTPIRLMLGLEETDIKGLFNETVLETDSEIPTRDVEVIIIANRINDTDITETLKSNLDFSYAEIDANDLPADDLIEDDKAGKSEKVKTGMEQSEDKTKNALFSSGDVALLTAESLIALRKTLTASIEVNMAVEYSKKGVPHHRGLMKSLAKSAARTVGKEAKEVTSKSLECEKSLKKAIKYASQSIGSRFSPETSRVLIDAIALSSVAKTMADVSSEIAINALYQVTELKL